MPLFNSSLLKQLTVLSIFVLLFGASISSSHADPYYDWNTYDYERGEWHYFFRIGQNMTYVPYGFAPSNTTVAGVILDEVPVPYGETNGTLISQVLYLYANSTTSLLCYFRLSYGNITPAGPSSLTIFPGQLVTLEFYYLENPSYLSLMLILASLTDPTGIVWGWIGFSSPPPTFLPREDGFLKKYGSLAGVLILAAFLLFPLLRRYLRDRKRVSP